MTYFCDRANALDVAWLKGGWVTRGAIFLAIGAVVWALGLFWKYPQGFLSLAHFPRLDDFLKLCADPLARDLNEPIVAYRLTAPVISYTLGLGPGLSVLLGWIALALSYATCWVALRARAGSLYALLVVFGLSQSFFAHASIRWLGIPDSITMLALSCCLVSRNTVVVAAATLLGVMNDERFLLAAPALLVWHLMRWEATSCEGSPAGLTLRNAWNRLSPVAVGILTGLIVTVGIRHALTAGWIGPGIERPHLYDAMAGQPVLSSRWEPYGSSWPLFFFNVVFSWAWMWVYIFYLVGKGLPAVNRWVALIFAAYLVAAIASTALVIDVSRSMGFLFPAFLAGALSLRLDYPVRSIRLAATIAVLMALTPGIYYGTHGSGAALIPYPLEAVNNLVKERAGVDLLESGKKYFSSKSQFRD